VNKVFIKKLTPDQGLIAINLIEEIIMERDQLIGGFLLVISVIVILVYGYLVFFYNEAIAILVLKITGFLAVLGVFGVLGWIGYTLATTPPPKPIEEIEKELEEELKKLEEEKKENEHSEGT